MAAPALKDLPKVDTDLKSQLESFSPKTLKNASTEEKILLPTAEGERIHKLRDFYFIYFFHAHPQTRSSREFTFTEIVNTQHNILLNSVPVCCNDVG
jgi:Thymosin beta-4 family